MKTSTPLFIVFCLCLSVGFLRLYDHAKTQFGDAQDLKREVEKARAEVQREKLKSALVLEQLHDFRQDIAATFPEKGLRTSKLAEFNQKQVINSIRKPASSGDDPRSSLLLARGKEEFLQKKYAESANAFSELIQKFPESGFIIEAHFLLGESFFLAGKVEECISVIDKMMAHYPDSEMTGYAMLRLGQIFEFRRRHVEAKEVFRAVERSFASPSLREQARILIKSVERR